MIEENKELKRADWLEKKHADWLNRHAGEMASILYCHPDHILVKVQ